VADSDGSLISRIEPRMQVNRLVPTWFQCKGSHPNICGRTLNWVVRFHATIRRDAVRRVWARWDSLSAGPRFESLTAITRIGHFRASGGVPDSFFVRVGPAGNPSWPLLQLSAGQGPDRHEALIAITQWHPLGMAMVSWFWRRVRWDRTQ